MIDNNWPGWQGIRDRIHVAIRSCAEGASAFAGVRVRANFVSSGNDVIPFHGGSDFWIDGTMNTEDERAIALCWDFAFQAGEYRFCADLAIEDGPIDVALELAEMSPVAFRDVSDVEAVARIHTFVDELERFIAEQSAVIAQRLTGPPIRD
jgi:hypothetical protein